MSKLPNINRKHRVCVICEGNEDHAYLQKLVNLSVWNKIYDFKLINVKSASNIFPKYQNEYNNNSYEIILVFCDTDKSPYKQYVPIKKKINEFHDRPSASGKIIIFANPCTMQIILLHFGEICLKKQGKKTNSDIILQLTGVENYDAHEEQIEIICKQINRQNYEIMKQRVVKINNSDTTSGSTNFSDFIEKFESDDPKWIEGINKYLSIK